MVLQAGLRQCAWTFSTLHIQRRHCLIVYGEGVRSQDKEIWWMCRRQEMIYGRSFRWLHVKFRNFCFSNDRTPLALKIRPSQSTWFIRIYLGESSLTSTQRTMERRQQTVTCFLCALNWILNFFIIVRQLPLCLQDIGQKGFLYGPFLRSKQLCKIILRYSVQPNRKILPYISFDCCH